ncbi:MAG TPA: serine/threonine-protein kinase [Planctomycetota bacterium]|nr:serine/threonine-protein kinase [Planctomycetota bacterium]
MRLGGYEVVERVGQGGAGVVFKARREGALVAVKLLKDRSAQARARFEREARLLGSFGEAEGFVPFLEQGDSPEGPYLVMPFIEGGSLRDRLRGGPLPVEDALALAREVGSALAHAHAKGIVHRDVKPENVLRQGDRWLLADLGVAKHFDDEAEGASRSVSLSKTGAVRGTLGYMAPEQINDAKSVGPPADVFALGVLLYEALAGDPPFAGATVLAVVAAAADGKAIPLRARRPDVPAWLASAVHRALAVDPAARPRTAAAFLEELERREGRGARRWGAILLGALALAGLVATTVVLRARPSVPEAAPSPGTRPFARPLAQELRALVKAGEGPGAEAVLAIASSWKDERIHADAFALAELHPAPFVAALEGKGEPRELLARAWLASGTLSRREEVRRVLGPRHPASTAMALVDDLAREVDAPTHLVEESEVDRFGRVLDGVAPATTAVRALVLAPFTSAVVDRFERSHEVQTWIRQVVTMLRKGWCPPELVAVTSLQAEQPIELGKLETLALELPLGSPLRGAVRYAAIRVKAFAATRTPDLVRLRAETDVVHAGTRESGGSLSMWIDTRTAIAHAAAHFAGDFTLGLEVARESYALAPAGELKGRAAGAIVALELAHDPALAAPTGFDDFDPNRTTPYAAEVLRRRGELARAREICRGWLRERDTDRFALEVLVHVEAQMGELEAARGTLHRLEKLDEQAGVWVPIHTYASTRAFLEAAEAGRR